MVERTLDGMAAGGMYDLVGGGFHRYSVDSQWLVPHFEKMLYDNALLVPAYLHGWLVLGKERYREVADETVTYLLRELALEGGGFASAQDADTDGVEGLTYTWTPEEGVPGELLRPFEHGRFVIRGSLDPELRARLLEERSRRPQPGRDDKAIASWNGLALAALAEAGRRLDRADALEAATRLGGVPARPALDRGRPPAPHVAGRRRRRAPATSTTTRTSPTASTSCTSRPATRAGCEESTRLARLAVELFADEERGGFFMTPADGEELVARQKDLEDNPIPSGNSMLAFVLLRLARIHGDDELERRAVSVLRLAARARWAASRARSAGRSARSTCTCRRRASSRSSAPPTRRWRGRARGFDPNAVVAFGPAPDVPLLEGKELVDGKPAVYVCERFACRAPVTDPAELTA